VSDRPSELAARVALRVAVCSRLVEVDPELGLAEVIAQAMRRRISVESTEAIRLHNEAFPRQPYHERTA
jgi:hypothetical protein